MNKVNQPKVITAWSMYDWANSVYSLVISSAIFPVYYNAVTKSETSDKVIFLGTEFVNTALFSYAISVGFLLIALLSPILSGIADYSGRKMSFMKFFCYMGSFSCMGMFFFESGSDINLGIGLYVLALIGFAGSIVFNNAYLPEIASVEERDRVSAKGFSMGYIGSTIMLIVSLVFIIFHDKFGMTEGLATRISFLITGLWWMGFAQITFNGLPKSEYKNKITSNIIFNGYKELLKVLKQVREMRMLKQFLVAFFFYNMSVQTVMYVATLFGTKELNMDTTMLIATILVIQLVAIPGSYLFSYLSSKWGNIKALILAVVIWIGIGTSAYFVFTSTQFIVLATVVGFVMGGIQSLSRSTYSKLIPVTKDTASFFSFFDVTEKVSIVMGTFMYGYLEVLTGSMRFSTLFFTALLLVGLIVLWRMLRTAKKSSPIL
jgi:MFS transporter, UMF1 family